MTSCLLHESPLGENPADMNSWEQRRHKTLIRFLLSLTVATTACRSMALAAPTDRRELKATKQRLEVFHLVCRWEVVMIAYCTCGSCKPLHEAGNKRAICDVCGKVYYLDLVDQSPDMRLLGQALTLVLVSTVVGVAIAITLAILRDNGHF